MPNPGIRSPPETILFVPSTRESKLRKELQKLDEEVNGQMKFGNVGETSAGPVEPKQGHAKPTT